MISVLLISLTVCFIVLASIISFLLLCCGKKEKEGAKAEKLAEGAAEVKQPTGAGEVKQPSLHITFKDATGIGAATSSAGGQSAMAKKAPSTPMTGSGPPAGNVGGLKGGPGATCPMMPVDEQDPEVLAYLKGQYPTANKLVSAPLPPGQRAKLGTASASKSTAPKKSKTVSTDHNDEEPTLKIEDDLAAYKNAALGLPPKPIPKLSKWKKP